MKVPVMINVPMKIKLGEILTGLSALTRYYSTRLHLRLLILKPSRSYHDMEYIYSNLWAGMDIIESISDEFNRHVELYHPDE